MDTAALWVLKKRCSVLRGYNIDTSHELHEKMRVQNSDPVPVPGHSLGTPTYLLTFIHTSSERNISQCVCLLSIFFICFVIHTIHRFDHIFRSDHSSGFSDSSQVSCSDDRSQRFLRFLLPCLQFLFIYFHLRAPSTNCNTVPVPGHSLGTPTYLLTFLHTSS